MVTFEPSVTTMKLMLLESADFIVQSSPFPFEAFRKVMRPTFCAVMCPLEYFQVPSGLLQELSLVLAPSSPMIYGLACETHISKGVITEAGPWFGLSPGDYLQNFPHSYNHRMVCIGGLGGPGLHCSETPA